MRLLLVDDHPIVLEGLNVLFGHVEGIEVIGSATTLDEAQRLIESQRPDVVLLDIRMGKTDSLPFARRLIERSQHGRETKVAFFTAYDDESYILRAMKIKAHGYLYKNTDPSFLIQAVQDIGKGAHVVSPEFGVKLLESGLPEADANEHGGLSTECLRILSFVAQGLTTTQIASKMSLSERTVKRRVSEALGILGASSRAEAVAEAYRLGLI